MPSNAVDGTPSTRWASQYTDGQWLSVDLGSRQPFSKVNLDWESAYGKDYDIQVSDDGTTWRTVAQRRGLAAAGPDTLAFPATTARHVRMQGITRATGYGYSLYSFEVLA